MVTIKDIEYAIGEHVNVDKKGMNYLLKYFKRRLELYTNIHIYYDKLKPCALCMLKGIQMEPILKSRNEKIGHGSNVDYYWVECGVCGIRGKEFHCYGTDGETEAIKHWNNNN